MADRKFDVESIVRLHLEGCCLEVGSDETGSAVEIRTIDKKGEDYFGKVRLTLYGDGDSYDFANALADAIKEIAKTL